jgi:CheY-like chemotaxis protein
MGRRGMRTQKRVLIVEDEDDTRTGLREFLERSGHLSAEASDGLAGLAQAETWHPHAILLDVRMPGLDGYEVCRRLKANPATKSIPVIVVTAVQDDALNRLACEAGAMACILKPFRLEALLAIIQTAIAGAERRARPKARREGNPP